MNTIIQAMGSTFCSFGQAVEATNSYIKNDDIFNPLSNIIQNIATVSALSLAVITKYDFTSRPILAGTLAGTAVLISMAAPIVEYVMLENFKVRESKIHEDVAVLALKLFKTSLKVANLFLAYRLYQDSHSAILPAIAATLVAINLFDYTRTAVLMGLNRFDNTSAAKNN